jgi:hypothetical protein
MVLRHVQRDASRTKPCHMSGRVIALSLPAVMWRPASLRLTQSIASEAHRSAVPVALMSRPATASQWRFSMVTCPM